MNQPRRVVRVTRDFFQDLDRQLPAERGPRGEPSRLDFETNELLPIIERFATGWDELPELIVGRPEYRLLITGGRRTWGWPLIPSSPNPSERSSTISKGVTKPRGTSQAGVRVLVIDEPHNVLAGRGETSREFLNLLRFLGNGLRILLVGVGIREAYLAQLLSSEPRGAYPHANP